MKIEDEIKQPKFKTPIQKALLNLIYTSNWLQSKQQDFFKTHGITATQFNILRILKGQHPKSISATEIKSRMLLPIPKKANEEDPQSFVDEKPFIIKIKQFKRTYNYLFFSSLVVKILYYFQCSYIG